MQQIQNHQDHLQFYGKLPHVADFVRFNATGEGIRWFDDWIREGLIYCQKKNIHNFKAQYRQSQIYNFICVDKRLTINCAGILCPSQDQSGRLFPFLVCTELKNGSDVHLPLSSIKHQISLSTDMRKLSSLAFSGVDQQELIAFTLSLSCAQKCVEIASSFFVKDKGFGIADFFSQVSPQTLQKDYLNYFRPLIDLLQALRGQKSETINFGLQLPLGKSSQNLHSIVGMWVELCERLLESTLHTYSLFWSQDSTEQNHLFLFFSLPKPRIFLQLCSPDIPVEYLWCLISELKRDSSILNSSILKDQELLINQNTDQTVVEFVFSNL